MTLNVLKLGGQHAPIEWEYFMLVMELSQLVISSNQI